jgi:hypothetical protein
MLTGVAGEKLLPEKFAKKTKSRQDALQTTFSVFLGIFYAPIFGCFDENGLFRHPGAITHTTGPKPSICVAPLLRARINTGSLHR